MIVLKNMAKVILPDSKKREVLSLYLHQSQSDSIRNYRYAKGVAYLPPNREKLQRVAEILGETIDDQRSNGAPLREPFTIEKGFQLREHQAVAAPKLLAEVQKNKYAVIQAGCGLGKTVVMTWVAGQLNCKILIIVDMGSLLSQWEEAFLMVWGKKSTILSRDHQTFDDVCITTFQLLHANPDLLVRISKEFGCLLLDEFHTTQSDTRREVLFRLDNQIRIGCTATPYKKGYSDEVLSDLVAEVSIRMVDAEALKPDVYFVETGVSFYNNNPDDWGKIQSKLAEHLHRNLLIIKLIFDLIAEGRKILVIGLTIKQCKWIESKIKQFEKAHAVVYTGSTSLRQDRKLKDDLAEGRINCILTVKKADKGLDLPLLDCLVLARPHNNKAFLEQISGRIVRPAEGKPQPVIYDLEDSGTLAKAFALNRARWYLLLDYRILAPKRNH